MIKPVYLEQKEAEYREMGNPEIRNTDLGHMWNDLENQVQEYVAEIGSVEWKNGFLCGYRDCLKELKHLENACNELAENGKGTKVGLMNGGKVIMTAMELCGYEIGSTGKYERR